MIKRILRKIKEISIPEKVMAVLAILALIAILLPILRLAMYSTPWYDDYSYTKLSKGWMIQLDSWWGVFKGAAETVRVWWYCWQGTYSSIFLMALSPLVFGEKFYWMGVMAIILFFVFATLLLVKTVLENVLKANGYVQVMAAAVVTAAMVEFVYNAQQGLFWYNSAIHYTFMHGVLFLLIATLVKVFYADKTSVVCGWTVWGSVLSVICAGSNFVTALQGLLCILIAAFLMVLYKKKTVIALAFPLVIYSIGFYLSVSAPGNAVRSAHFQGYGVIKSILYSFYSAFKNFWELTGFRFFFALALFVLIIWNVVKESKFAFKYPGLVSFFSLCFYATGYTPSYYGGGEEGIARTWVVVKFTLLILLFMNAAYWLGWGMKQWEKKRGEVGKAKHWVWSYAIIAVGILCCFLFTEGQARDFSTFGAYYYVHTGEAANHYTEYLQRVETIKNGGANVEVKPIFWKPWFLFKGELSTNPYAEENKEMADWYGKESITLKLEDETN